MAAPKPKARTARRQDGSERWGKRKLQVFKGEGEGRGAPPTPSGGERRAGAWLSEGGPAGRMFSCQSAALLKSPACHGCHGLTNESRCSESEMLCRAGKRAADLQ